MEKEICPRCKKIALRITAGVCHNCYRKFIWKKKIVLCPRCERMLPHHSRGLCGGCYQSTYHLEGTRDNNTRKRHNIEPELYRKITKECIICGFDKIVDLHHIDENRKNNSRENMVGICPNHHKMYHTLRFKEEIGSQLKIKLLSKAKILHFQ